MRSAGYTLVELLVVISIISLLSVLGSVSFSGFSEDQVIEKSKGQVQTLLRLAQSNASSSTLCNNQGASTWSVKFVSNTTMQLHCEHPEDYSYRSYSLERNTQVEFSCPLDTLKYSVGSGALTISPTGPCIDNASTITITIRHIKTNHTKSFNLSKGGAIDVQ